MQRSNHILPSPAKNRYSGMVFWMAVLLLLFCALGTRGLWSSEDRWAEIAREMLLTGDFFHPTLNGIPYFDKPLLTYWLVLFCHMITGNLNEWTVRLPSAVSGLLGLWATVQLGRRLWSEEVGRTAGWILLSTYGFLLWSRAGTAEMENLAAIVLAVLWYWVRREKLNFISYLVFYLICLLGAQLKGLASVAVPVLAIAPDLIKEGRLRKTLSLSHLLALAIGITIYLAPFLYASISGGAYPVDGLFMVFRENIQRYFQPFDHKEPFYVYFTYLPQLFMPWAPMLITAFLGIFGILRNHQNERTRWLIECIIIIFLFFDLSGSRRGYYILPILPFCALFVSVFLNTGGSGRLTSLGFNLQKWLFILTSFICILSPAIFPIIRKFSGFVPPQDFLYVILLLGIVVFSIWFLNHLKPGLLSTLTGTNRKIAPLIASAVIFMGGYFCWMQVILDTERTEKVFAIQLKTLTAGISREDIAFYNRPGANILFYAELPVPIPVLRDVLSVQSFLKSGGHTKILVSELQYIDDFLSSLPAGIRNRPVLSERIYAWENKKRKLTAWKIE